MSAPLGSLTATSQAKSPLSTSARCAGFGMLLTSLLTFASVGLLADVKGSGIGSAVITLLLGVMLMAGNPSVLPFARFRAWFGMILGIPLMWATAGPIEGVFQGVWAFSLLLLLGDKPGRARRIIGGILFTVALGLGGLSIAILKFGPGPLTSLVYQGKTDPLPPDLIAKTTKGSLQVKFPNSDWSLLKRDEINKINALFDVWVVRTNADLHVAVLPEEADDMALEAYRKNVLDNLSGSKLVSEEKVPQGTLLHFAEEQDGVQAERLLLLCVTPHYVYQVHAWCTNQAFVHHEKELRSVLSSVQAK